MTLFKITVPYTLVSTRIVYVLANEAIRKAEEELEQPIKYTTIEVF